MAASFPGSIKSFTTKTDQVDDVEAAHVNELQLEVTAIETALGANMRNAQGIKGWINFNGTGTIAINDSYNVSGIVDEGTGDYTVTWDTDFANANYCVVGSCGDGTNSYPLVNLWAIAAGSVRVKTPQVGSGNTDFAKICVLAIGD